MFKEKTLIIFVGVAGSGKSVQGRMLAETLKAHYFSMGDFLRRHLDPVIQEKMLTGELISDDQVIGEIVKEWSKVKTIDEEVIVDGFPRTLVQADWLLSQAEEKRFKITAIINLAASAEIITERLLGRKRPDDHLEAIKLRIKEYNKATLPIIERMKRAGVKIFNIDAERPVDEVHADIIKALSET